jgi:CheY-like chemotaxis protein
VAHDFNNLLTVVIGSLDLALGRVQTEMRPVIESSLRAAERGAALVRQLLAFSRRQTLIPEALDFNRLVSGMEDLLRRTLGEHIGIEMKLASELWSALADKGQVESALLNLAVNARDAMPAGGKLTIETGNTHLDKDYAIRNAEVTPGDYVMLAVTDTGTGMPPEVIEHAFEPFFTTKEIGKGSGLGLSMIYGFAKQSGGHLKIYSELGHGTTVRLYLPRLSAEAAPATTALAGPADHPRGGETILVVEDDADVRRFVVGQLRDLGYRVLEAADGPSAQTILDSDQSIDLLLTDVVMPGGITGRHLAEEAKQRRPNLKTLYSSGYTENSIVHQGKLDPGVHFLAKPFRRQDLAVKVREALDAA